MDETTKDEFCGKLIAIKCIHSSLGLHNIVGVLGILLRLLMLGHSVLLGGGVGLAMRTFGSALPPHVTQRTCNRSRVCYRMWCPLAAAAKVSMLLIFNFHEDLAQRQAGTAGSYHARPEASW